MDPGNKCRDDIERRRDLAIPTAVIPVLVTGIHGSAERAVKFLEWQACSA